MTATIDMTSIDTANATRDEHLRTADFFEASRGIMSSSGETHTGA